ncbi:MAG: hypothetical protein GY710_13095 [Desulfobacteraceae bacterium]|nr:hypothetical protein [Desulfobacteraceae bacterium]
MKLKFTLLFLLITFCFVGCAHKMDVTNIRSHFSPPIAPPKTPIKIGIKSSDDAVMEKSKYISAIVDAIKRSGSFEKTIYPYKHSVHNGDVDVVVDLSVMPKYSGSGSNFLVNWPGFLIFAPAFWGYGYNADIATMVNITFAEQNISQQIAVPLQYKFRHAAINRTWTEIGWLEFGIIPFIGGIAFTQYDPKITPDFISSISTSYGASISNKIIETIYSNPVAELVSKK